MYSKTSKSHCGAAVAGTMPSPGRSVEHLDVLRNPGITCSITGADDIGCCEMGPKEATSSSSHECYEADQKTENAIDDKHHTCMSQFSIVVVAIGKISALIEDLAIRSPKRQLCRLGGSILLLDMKSCKRI